MPRQSLTWTALPNGYTADQTGIRLSVLLSPRLDIQDPTATHKKLSVFFPDWEDWPKTLSNASVRGDLQRSNGVDCRRHPGGGQSRRQSPRRR